MAEECGESTTVISSSTPPNWWHELHGSSSSNISPWTTTGSTTTTSWHQHHQHHHHPNPTSSTSTADDDASMSISYTNNSNHSVITNESASHHQLAVEQHPSTNVLIPGHFPDNHLLSPLLYGGSSMSKLHNNSINNNNLMESKSVLDPAFDYLKKWDNNCSWEDIPPPPPSERMIDVERERLTNLVGSNNSSMLFPPQTCGISLGTSSAQAASSSGFCDNLKQMLMSDSTINSSSNNYGLVSPFKRHAFKEEHENLETTTTPFSGLTNNNDNMEFPLGMKISSLLVGGGGGGDYNNKYGYGITNPSYTRVRNNHEDGAPFITSSNISDYKRRNGFLTSSPPIRVNVRGHVHTTTEGRKRTAEETSETILKKTKSNNNNINSKESSTVSSSVKMPATKAKLGDRITALQQIVSPFGKTDTASVLMEAIAYIKCLQEQVQLLVSNPYLKMNPHKQDHWIGMDRKNKEDLKIDLRSKGLCLMPISCTSQIYRDANAGSDCWMPPYRRISYRSSNC